MARVNRTGAGLSLAGVEVSVADGPDRRVILDGVDLSVSFGEVIAVTGASGSGKSTLLAVAGLLRRADQGEVTIAGHDTTALSERARTALRGERIGIVYQSANLLPSLTALEQLEIVGDIRGMRRRAARDRARALLAAVALDDHVDQLPASMSGGERQRVGIARALMAEPVVLLADEPTASLDGHLATEVASLLVTQAREHGLATVIVTHDDEPLRHVDRRLHLADGRLAELPVSVS